MAAVAIAGVFVVVIIVLGVGQGFIKVEGWLWAGGEFIEVEGWHWAGTEFVKVESWHWACQVEGWQWAGTEFVKVESWHWAGRDFIIVDIVVIIKGVAVVRCAGSTGAGAGAGAMGMRLHPRCGVAAHVVSAVVHCRIAKMPLLLGVPVVVPRVFDRSTVASTL